MTGQCALCALPVWEADPSEYAALVVDQPDSTPPENLVVGGLSFCNEEHLDGYLAQHPEQLEGCKRVVIST